MPVIDAHVKATIFKPGGDLDASSPLTFVLRDNGAGYPDITAGDGIYSGYFADYATVPGLYTVRVVADNNDGLARTPKVQAAFSSLEDFKHERTDKNGLTKATGQFKNLKGEITFALYTLKLTTTFQMKKILTIEASQEK